ncbi:hypothetical protein ANCCAN_30524 [Ancylostoma caninum]|uniref:Uncharacterized protein n=1 Tax=Ancylostoma caninum TaxID=29170 RepID=A0A368EWY1_ANCCA|nr:hypothetical protein ANCCAN_30524 [Ancylostoma caninum]
MSRRSTAESKYDSDYDEQIAEKKRIEAEEAERERYEEEKIRREKEEKARREAELERRRREEERLKEQMVRILIPGNSVKVAVVMKAARTAEIYQYRV